MQWSPKQEAALKAVSDWLADPNRKQVFKLFGYAGTGKTTMARILAESCGGQVLFAAYTGKAASVMKASGCLNATTIHRLIYKPQPKSDVRLLELKGHLAELNTTIASTPKDAEEYTTLIQSLEATEAEIEAIQQDLKRPAFVLNFDSPVKRAKLIVIDECSMVNESMGRDLESFGTPILVLGDPAQLPPVAAAGYFTNGNPDVMLTEIHRQAQDSPIIRLATLIREGGYPSPGQYGESLVVPKGDLDPESVMVHDQILVGRNTTRSASNVRARQILKRGADNPLGHLPVAKDRLVCLRNDHMIGLLNGEIWTVQESIVVDNDSMCLTLLSEDRLPLVCDAHRAPFEGRELDYREQRLAQSFDYGYALTTHKAQGSQWPAVIIFDESYCFRADRKRWLYTAVTRASQRVTLVTGF